MLKNLKNINNLIENIIKWHKETFPDATLEGQLNKLNEELNEFLNAYTKENILEEAADIFIVECALLRWNALVSYTKLILMANFGFNHTELIEAVKKKMEKNKKRVWKKTSNESYHHVEE